MGEFGAPQSERFRSDPRTGRSACDRLSMEQDRPSEPSAQMAGGVALARLGEREAIIMQMQQVDYFLTLCEELNFTRAARRCGVSQPSLTTAIGALERELGGALFYRKPALALIGLGRMVWPCFDDMES